MNLPVILEKYRPEIDCEIKREINEHTMPLYDMMRYHFGWIDKNGHPAEGDSGKALRPALCLFCCESVGGEYHQALPAAVALELIHNFSLIHDDIQDNDRERRHRQTVWAVWGQAQAINAGTAMRILANCSLRRLPVNCLSLERQFHLNELIDEVSLRLIEGQYLDISFEQRYDIGVADYLNMIDGKTAALISASMEMGAYLGTVSKSIVKTLREVGRNLGLAFQIRDDILGIWGDTSKTGKSAGGDIRRRKKSYPVVYALEHAKSGARQDLISMYKKGAMDQNSVERVLGIFETVNTLANAQKAVETYCRAGMQDFDQLKLGGSAKDEMHELIEFLTGRNY